MGDDSQESSSSVYLVAVVVGICIYYVYQRSAKAKTWSIYGVKSPVLPWNYFFDTDFRKPISQLLTEYGDTVGAIRGGELILFTTNFDIMRQVLIKDFNNFVERADTLPTRSKFSQCVFFAKNRDWKRQRQIVSPTFSSGKLKHISSTVNKSAMALTQLMINCAKSGDIFAIKDPVGHYSSEIIAKTGFGLNVSFIGEKSPEFYEYSKNLIKTRSKYERFLLIFISLIPGLNSLLRRFEIKLADPISEESDSYFNSILQKTIEDRRNKRREGKSQTDFLELLLRANEDAASGQLDTDTDDDVTVLQTNSSSKTVKSLTEDEVYGQSILIIFAGFETTSQTLQFALFELARNQDIQEKVYQEVNSILQSDTATTEELGKLLYTEQVINEILRLYPPAPVVNRRTNETKTYHGITIPKGANVTIPFFHIFRDPNIYPDPERFDPDRFSQENKDGRDPMAFTPFGVGPRQCLGMRLAYLELKTALSCILKKVKVVLNEKTYPRAGTEVQYSSLKYNMPTKPIELAFELR